MGSRLLTCLLLGAVGIIMLTVGSVLGGLSGDKNSPFYMIALIGFFPIVGAFLYVVAGDRDNE